MDLIQLQHIRQLRSGDESAFDALREQYAALLLSMVSGVMASRPDAEFEDLMQEATLALYHAALSYDLTQKEVTFGLYAKVCIRNRLVSALRKLQKTARASNGTERVQLAPEQKKSARRAPMAKLSHLVDSLFSDYEKAVYRLYLEGYSASEIALRLGRSDKSVDNAIYRMRRKIKEHFDRS